jgi:iron complex transport system substrate-binding protein
LSQLAELGFAVWSIEIRQPDEIATAIEHIGKATGTSSSATIAADSIRFKIKALRSRYAQAEQVSYFYQVASQPLFTVNGEHLISHGLNLCGGYNVFAELPALAPQIGREAVLMADPDVLIAPNIEGHPDPLAHWQSWPRIRAVSQENYILLPADEISRATPRFVDAVELACTMMDDLRIN